jgi:hypothetical protein
VVVGELGRHVGPGVDVHDPVGAVGGPEHGESVAVVRPQLEVDPRSGGPERSDELVEDTVALHVAEARQDTQAGMQVHRHAVAGVGQDESLETHGSPSAAEPDALRFG